MKAVSSIMVLLLLALWPAHGQHIQYTGGNSIHIIVHSQTDNFEYQSGNMLARLDISRGLIELHIPLTALSPIKGSSLSYFANTFGIDDSTNMVIGINLLLPDEQIDLSEFIGNEQRYGGEVTIGDVLLKSPVFFEGLYKEDQLIFDFEISIEEQFNLNHLLSDGKIKAIEIFSKGSRIVNLTDE